MWGRLTTGKASVPQPVNLEQVAAAFPVGFTARNNDQAGTVEIESTLTDQQTHDTLAAITYRPPAAQPAAEGAVRWVAGMFYRPNGVRDTSFAVIAGRCYYIRLPVPADGGISQVGVSVASAVASVGHVGVMADIGGLPGVRLAHDGGTIDGGSATVQAGTVLVPTLAAHAPAVWLAVVFVGGRPSIHCFANGGAGVTPGPSGHIACADMTLATQSPSPTGFYEDGATGIPTAAGPLTITGANLPSLGVKASAPLSPPIVYAAP